MLIAPITLVVSVVVVKKDIPVRVTIALILMNARSEVIIVQLTQIATIPMDHLNANAWLDSKVMV